MNSSNSVSGPSPSIAPPTRSFLVLLLDGTRLRVSSSDLAAQLRQERSAGLKRLRQARAEALAQAADSISEARIRSAFEANERAMDAAIRRLSKQVRVKPEPKRQSSPAQSPQARMRRTGHSGLVLVKRAHAASALARRDRRGREGLMLRIRYVRAGGKHASPGCLRRHWFYITREAAVTLDSVGEPILLGNLGDTIDDVAEGVALQEQVLRATRKNAKLGFRMVGAFPYGFPVDARREVLQRIGEQVFGARGLPWSGAAHDSDPDADVDNPHFHLDYGLLPMARQPDGSFVVSNDLRTDLDGQEGLRFIRHMVAHVMTEVAQEYGLERTFTALSYRERGMDREGGEHVGQEATAAQRRGDYVAAVARNEARRWGAEARDKARKARERLDTLERLKRAIAAEAASTPSMTMPPELDTDPSGAISAVPTISDLPAMVDAFSAAPAPRLTGPDLPFIMPRPRAAPHLDAVPASLTMRLPSPVRGSPPVPPVTVVSAPVEPMSSPPAVLAVAPRAPTIVAPPRPVRIGHAPPRMATIAKPYAVPAQAPSVETLPVLVPVGDLLPVLSGPPKALRIGAQAPRLRDPQFTLLNVEQAIVTDAVDDAVEAHVNDVIEREAARRLQAAAERTVEPYARTALPQQPNAHAPRAAPPMSAAARAAALDALRQRDDWVSWDERGHYTVPQKALAEVGLTPAELVLPAIQAALEAIGTEQRDRFDAVFNEPYDGAPFQRLQGGLRLDGRFSATLQADVARWSANPHFQSFVEELWPLTRTERALSPARVDAPPSANQHILENVPAVPLDPWMQAAAVRQRAMAEWDEVERSDGVGMTRPGRVLLRPGRIAVQDIAEAATQDRKPMRLHPGMFPGGGGSIGN